MKQPRIRVMMLVTSIVITLVAHRLVDCASCGRAGDPLGEQSDARVTLSFILAFFSFTLVGYLFAYLWDLALSRLLVATYKSILLWHFVTLSTYLVILSVVDFNMGSYVTWFSKLVAVLAIVAYLEFKTYLKGFELGYGIWWKTYLVVVGLFCLDFPTSRLFATIWLVLLIRGYP